MPTKILELLGRLTVCKRRDVPLRKPFAEDHLAQGCGCPVRTTVNIFGRPEQQSYVNMAIGDVEEVGINTLWKRHVVRDNRGILGYYDGGTREAYPRFSSPWGGGGMIPPPTCRIE